MHEASPSVFNLTHEMNDSDTKVPPSTHSPLTYPDCQLLRAVYRCSGAIGRPPTHRSLKSYQNSSQDVQIPFPSNPKATSRPIPVDRHRPPLDIARRNEINRKKLSAQTESSGKIVTVSLIRRAIREHPL